MGGINTGTDETAVRLRLRMLLAGEVSSSKTLPNGILSEEFHMELCHPCYEDTRDHKQ